MPPERNERSGLSGGFLLYRRGEEGKLTESSAQAVKKVEGALKARA